MTFREFLMIDEGLLLPDQPRWKGMSRINPLPCTNAERRRLMPKKPPKVEPFQPTVASVGKPPKLYPPKPKPVTPAFKPTVPRPPSAKS